MIQKYVKKPVIIEAVQWTGDNLQEVINFIDEKNCHRYQYCKESSSSKVLRIKTIASVGDYIIKGVKGDFYPCQPDLFAETYEKVQLDFEKK